MTNSMYRLKASLTNIDCPDSYDFKNRKMSQYQCKIKNKFDQSTSYDEIEEEFPYGSGEFRTLKCRVVSVRTVDTGTKMSDSYKKIIFQDMTHPKNVGYLYRFNNNYWITHNTNIMQTPTDSVVVRRCNNVMRWIDDYGGYHEIPISFEEDAYYLTNDEKQEIQRSNGYRKGIIQRTDLTRTISPNQRFIFGNQCLKISGSGLNGFLNQETFDDNSPATIKVTFEYDVTTPNDDLVNKIANAYSNKFNLKINDDSSEYTIDKEYIFTSTLFKNDNIISNEYIWEVESTEPYLMNQENNSLNIKFEGVGQYYIKVSLKDNLDISDSIIVNTVDTETYQIVNDNNTEKIYKGESEVFNLSISKDGVIVPGDIIFEKIDSLTLKSYSYEVNGNSIIIQNISMSNSPVMIKCYTNDYENIEPYILNIMLGGAW